MSIDEINASFGNEAKLLEEQNRIVQAIQACQSNFVMKLKDLSAHNLTKEDVAVLSRSILEEFEAFKSASESFKKHEILSGIDRLRSLIPDFYLNLNELNQSDINNIHTLLVLIIDSAISHSHLNAIKGSVDIEIVNPISMDSFDKLEAELIQAWSQTSASINKLKTAVLGGSNEKLSAESLVSIVVNIRSLHFKYNALRRFLNSNEMKQSYLKVVDLQFEHAWSGIVAEFVHLIDDIIGTMLFSREI